MQMLMTFLGEFIGTVKSRTARWWMPADAAAGGQREEEVCGEGTNKSLRKRLAARAGVGAGKGAGKGVGALRAPMAGMSSPSASNPMCKCTNESHSGAEAARARSGSAGTVLGRTFCRGNAGGGKGRCPWDADSRWERSGARGKVQVQEY